MASNRKQPWPRRILLIPLVLTGLVIGVGFREALPPCLFHQVTGLHCPGCGATRATESLLSFQWGMALRQNAFWTLAVIIGTLFLILNVAGERFPRVRFLGWFRWRNDYLWGILAALIVFALVRNLLGFSWMNP
ncbi:MAG: DUF2752 domain-containing protein [Akkermansiaceae bacterium]